MSRLWRAALEEGANPGWVYGLSSRLSVCVRPETNKRTGRFLITIQLNVMSGLRVFDVLVWMMVDSEEHAHIVLMCASNYTHRIVHKAHEKCTERKTCLCCSLCGFLRVSYEPGTKPGNGIIFSIQ